MGRKALLIILTLTGISRIYAYPITPQTLRKQIEDSKYIVIAIIDNPEPEGEKFKILNKNTGDSSAVQTFSLWGDGTASLKILKVLKGEIENNSIVVNYPSDMSNPRPPRYPNQKKVIAFLNDNDTASKYTTVGLSYGTILFERNEPTDIFEKLINEYIPISRIKNIEKKEKLTASWLVKCCKERSTRWNGAYELNRSRHWMSYYDHSNDNEYSKYLSEEERNTLAQIVLNCDTISYNELCLSDFVSIENEEKLKDVLIFNLKYFRIFFSKDLMKKYLELENNSELKLIYEKYKELDLTNRNNEENATSLNTRFIQLAEKK